MMPGAGFFYYHTLHSFSCPMGGRESRLQSVTKGRCSPHPPRGPSFVLLHLYAAPQDVGLGFGAGLGLSAISGSIGPGLCRMLYMEFREFPSVLKNALCRTRIEDGLRDRR